MEKITRYRLFTGPSILLDGGSRRYVLSEASAAQAQHPDRSFVVVERVKAGPLGIAQRTIWPRVSGWALEPKEGK